MKWLTNNKVNVIFITILVLFFLMVILIHFEDRAIPDSIEKSIYDESITRDNSKQISHMISDGIITWKEYLTYLWSK